VTENGFGKRTEYSQYPAHRRGGKGVITIVTNERNGPVSRVRSVAETDELIFTSADGIIIRIPAKDISIQGRNTQGVRIINLKPGDKVAGVARIQNGKAEEELKLTASRAKKSLESTPAGEETEVPEDEAEDFEEPEEFEDFEVVEEAGETEEVEENEEVEKD